MPHQVRIITGPADRSFDHFIRDVIDEGALEQERHYFGIEDENRARFVYNKLKTAGRHMKPPHAVRSFYYPCTGCPEGGPSCRFHVSYTVYDMEKARAYVARRSELARDREQ